MAALDLGALPTGTLVSSETSGFFPLGGGFPDRAFFVLCTYRIPTMRQALLKALGVSGNQNI